MTIFLHQGKWQHTFSRQSKWRSFHSRVNATPFTANQVGCDSAEVPSTRGTPAKDVGVGAGNRLSLSQKGHIPFLSRGWLIEGNHPRSNSVFLCSFPVNCFFWEINCQVTSVDKVTLDISCVMYAMVKLTMYLFRVYSDFRENMLSAKLVFALGHCPTETAVSFVCLFFVNLPWGNSLQTLRWYNCPFVIVRLPWFRSQECVPSVPEFCQLDD